MTEYHVIKIDICPACLGQKPGTGLIDPFCGKCNGSGRIQSVASFEEALEQTSIGKNFQKLIENMNRSMEQVMGEIQKMVSTISKKGLH